MKPVIEAGIYGRWIIVHPSDPSLAWSGSRWVPHLRGMPTAGAQVSNFETPEEAADTAAAQIGEVADPS